MLPILHLNGYKISGATVLGRADDADVLALLAAQGWAPVVVAGDDPATVFTALHRELAVAHARIRAIQQHARTADGADKQPHLQYLTLDEANTHCAAGASVWDWAGTEQTTPGRQDPPDVVLACAGDVPTLETLAAARLLREHVPYLRVRVVNVVDLMGLLPPDDHPHGLAKPTTPGAWLNQWRLMAIDLGYSPRTVDHGIYGCWSMKRCS